jgi:hypothetical protein
MTDARTIVEWLRKEGALANVARSDSAVEKAEERLNARRDTALRAVDDDAELQRTKPNQEIAAIGRALGAEDDKLRREQRERRPKAVQAEAWREAGILERLRVPTLPRWARWLILGFLASIDFYVFALAIARDQDVAASPFEPLFLFGGLLGLVVFIAGIALARQVKEVIYARQQKQLLDDIDRGYRIVNDSVRRNLVTSNPPWVMITVTATMFALLVGYAFAIRWWEMSANDNPNVVIFLSLIPLLAVCVELYLYDPTDVAPPTPSRKARQLLRQRELCEAELGDIRARTEQSRGRVEGLYREAAAALAIEVERLRGAREPAPPGGEPTDPFDPD